MRTDAKADAKTDATTRSSARRRRLGGLGAGIAAIAIGITGFAVPSANALPIEPGTWTFDEEFGTSQFGTAWGAAVDQATGEFYVTDVTNDKLLKFDRNGKKLGERGSSGDGFGNFAGPRGVAVDANYVYVADTGNQIVQRFTKDLDVAGQLGMLDSAGDADGQFDAPVDVTVDGEGHIYVADAANSRVQKFNGDLSYLGKWGSQGQGNTQFNFPRGITATPGGQILVADTGNHRISAWSSGGDALGNFGTLGSDPGQFDTPADIVVDKNGNILVADAGNDRIQHLNGLGGAPIASWSIPHAAQGVAYDSGQGRVYVPSGENAVLSYRQATTPSISAGPAIWGTAGKAYSSTLTATGFPDVFTWAVTGGALPTGLKLASGKVSGVPTKPGTYQVTLGVDNDVLVNPAVTKSYTVKIYKASSRVTAKFSTKYPRVARTNIRATIKLSAPYTTGLSKTGKVRVYYGKKRVKTYSVSASKNGVIKVRLPKFSKKGKTKVTLRYLGNSQLKSAKRTIYVRVR